MLFDKILDSESPYKKECASQIIGKFVKCESLISGNLDSSCCIKKVAGNSCSWSKGEWGLQEKSERVMNIRTTAQEECGADLKALNQLVHKLQQPWVFPEAALVCHQDTLAFEDLPTLYLLQIVLSQRHPRAHLPGSFLAICL